MAMAKTITTPSPQEGVTRRNLIKTAPLSGILLLGGASAASGGAPDPILPLYSQWVDARAKWARLAQLSGNENFDMPESKAEEAKEYAAFDAMCETTPTSLAGIAALAHVLWDLHGPVACPDSAEFVEAAGSQNCKIIQAIWRAASSESGFPNAGEALSGRRCAG